MTVWMRSCCKIVNSTFFGGLMCIIFTNICKWESFMVSGKNDKLPLLYSYLYFWNLIVRPIFGYRLPELGHFQDSRTFIRRIGFGWHRKRRLEAIIIRNRLSPNRLLLHRHHREEVSQEENMLFSKLEIRHIILVNDRL